jgi:putative ATPase
MTSPVANRIRPKSLEDVVGQEKLVGAGGILHKFIESGNLPNMIFYGPSGTGKTTVAEILAQKTDRTLIRLNGTTASVADVKEALRQPGTLMAPKGILLFLDEIQYFNKKQQQTMLEFLEAGKMTLIASTTENPYFYVYNALLPAASCWNLPLFPPKKSKKPSSGEQSSWKKSWAKRSNGRKALFPLREALPAATCAKP